jgi:hypothetical protein
MRLGVFIIDQETKIASAVDKQRPSANYAI